jgi:hypothetical protein
VDYEKVWWSEKTTKRSNAVDSLSSILSLFSGFDLSTSRCLIIFPVIAFVLYVSICTHLMSTHDQSTAITLKQPRYCNTARNPFLNLDSTSPFQLSRSHMIIHPIPYIALSTSLLTAYQSALLSANSYTSSARKIP